MKRFLTKITSHKIPKDFSKNVGDPGNIYTFSNVTHGYLKLSSFPNIKEAFVGI